MSAGYEFVPLPDRVQRQERPQAIWHRRYPGALSGVLRVRLRAEQDVHVGSGIKRLQDGKVVRKVVRMAVRIQDRPGIPGSSLKGVLRGRYEAITRSCVPQKPPLGQMVSIRSSTGIRQARLRLEDRSERYLKTECDDRQRCPACALFGRMSLRSRVAVQDLFCAGGEEFAIALLHAQFSPNLHHVGKPVRARDRSGQEYFEVGSLHGRKFAVGVGPIADKAEKQWIEVIPAGSVVEGTIRLFNVLPAELGGLLAALGKIPASALKIGGGKGRGFGRMRLDGIAYDLRDDAGKSAAADEAGWRAAFAGSDDRWQDGEQRLCEIHEGDC